MPGSAYIEDPEELAKFTASTSTTQFPAAISPIAPLYRLEEGATSSASENQIMLTVQGEGIQIYSALDNKCLRSWTFPPNTRFACPAKYSANSSKEAESYVYVALDSGDGIGSQNRGAVVWRWTDRGIDSIGLEDKIEAIYLSPVFSLEPGATRAGHLLAVHVDGTMTLSRRDLSKTFGLSATVPGHAQLIWYQLVDVSQNMRSYLDSRQVTDWLDGDFRLVLALNRVKDLDDTDKGAFSYYFSLLAIDGLEATISEVGTTRVNPIHLRTSPLSCAFDADSGTVALLTQAGVYQNLSLKVGSSALDDPVILDQTKEVTLRGFVPCGSGTDENDGAVALNLLTQSQLTMTSLSERYVAIAGTHSVVSHASKGPYESVLTLWDLQYGCLHAERPISVASAHLSAGSKQKHKRLPRMVYQIQPLSPRLSGLGVANDQISLGIMAAHTSMPHSFFDGDAAETGVHAKKVGKAQSIAWSVEMFYASAFLPPVTLLASLRLQNNAKYYVDPIVQSARAKSVVHSSNILLHEEQEQGLGVLRSGWEAIADGTVGDVAGKPSTDTVEMFLRIGHRRENTQKEENEVLLALANVSDSVNSDQYAALFMDHIGVALKPDSPVPAESSTWISAYLMTTVMRRCFAEPLGVSRSSQLPLFAPRVIEFMLLNCGLCNSHAPAPGLLPHLLARVDKSCSILSDDQAWKIIDIALRHCPDLPEKQVVDILQFQLFHYAKLTDRLFDVNSSQPTLADGDISAAELANVAADVKRTVSAIVTTKGNDDMLRLALSALPLGHAACLIRLLVTWLREWTQLGANVEIAASAVFVSSTNSPMPSELYDSGIPSDAHDNSNSATLSEIIALANDSSTSHHQQKGAPSVDASLTIFREPRKTTADEGSKAAIVRAFTKKWAPALELPEQLVGAPEIGVVVGFVSLLLDAHMTNILLSAEFSGLISRLKSATDEALAISDQLRLLRIGLLPFNSAWEKQHEERVAKDVAKQKEMLGLDEVVLRNGTTRSQAEHQRQLQPNARCAQGTGSTGTYWEQVHKLEKYRVEVMHW